MANKRYPLRLNQKNLGRILREDANPLVQQVAQDVVDAGERLGLHLNATQDDVQQHRAGAEVHPALLQDMRRVGRDPALLVQALNNARRG